jgi:hypothetical protein
MLRGWMKRTWDFLKDQRTDRKCTARILLIRSIRKLRPEIGVTFNKLKNCIYVVKCLKTQATAAGSVVGKKLSGRAWKFLEEPTGIGTGYCAGIE